MRFFKNPNEKLVDRGRMKYYLGIDLGGTFVKGGVVDENGKIIVSDKTPTEAKKGLERVMDNVARLSETLIAAAKLTKADIGGAGMGVPGMIDSKKGEVVVSNNLDWLHAPVAEMLKERTGLDFKISNDANVAALGEATYGAGSDFEDSVLITLGTGIGGGVIVGNKMVEGNKSAGAELGHMVIVDGGEQCTCGRKGCFEAYCSATALIRDTKRAMLAHKDSEMWEIGDIEKVTGKTAFDYKNTDKYAKEVVDNYIEKLACGLANIANIFRPHAIMLGGGVCAQGDNLVKPVQEIIDREVFGNIYGPKCPVMIAKLGNTAGILGAAALAMKN